LRHRAEAQIYPEATATTKARARIKAKSKYRGSSPSAQNDDLKTSNSEGEA
jgi:hypothetical protein